MAVAVVDVRVTTSDAVSNLRRLEQASKNTSSVLDNLTRQAAGVGTALVGGFALNRVINDVVELDRNIRRLGTVGMDIAKISPALSKLSEDLGGVASKAELAAASYQAASAGFSDTAGNIQILNAATKAAVGGLADTQAVTEVLVKTLNAYGMSGSQAFQVTDSISKAVELGNQEWSDYTALLGRVVSTTALAGVSINELNAFIAAATKNGATAEVAFTGLSGVLNTLLQPTKESQDAAAKLGIAWNYGGLQAKGFTGLMAELAIAMQKDKETTARLLGSQEAMRGAFAANAKAGADYKMILEQIGGSANKTNQDFQTMKGSLENTLKALDTSFKNLSEALGTTLGPSVVLSIKDITNAVNTFASIVKAIPQPVISFAGEIVKLTLQAILLKKAFEAIIALRVAFVAATTAMAASTAMTATAANSSATAFNVYTNNAKTLAAQSAAASAKVTPLGNALRSIASMGIITVAVNIAVTGLSQVIQANAELNRLRQRRAAGGAAAVFAGSTKEEVIRQQGIAKKTKQFEQRQQQQLTSPGARFAQFFNIGGVLSPFGVPTIGQAGQRERISKATIREAEAVLGLNPNAFPSLLQNGGGGGGTGDGGPTGTTARGSKEAEAAARRAAEQIANARSLRDLTQAQFNIEGQILDARSQNNEALVITRTAQKELASIASEIADTKANKELPNAARLAKIADLEIKAKGVARQFAFDLATAEKTKAEQAAKALESITSEITYKQNVLALGEDEANQRKRIAELVAQGADPKIAEQKIKEEVELNKKLLERQFLLQQEQQLLNGIGNTFNSVITGLIQGTDNWANSLQSALNSLANLFLQAGLQGLAGNDGRGFFSFLTGSLGKRANGGSVMAGQPYLVGERGPELFMPGRSGGIAPAGNFGGGTNITVNVDAKGTNVQGNGGRGDQLARAVAMAVQAEMIKQRRPGGILA